MFSVSFRGNGYVSRQRTADFAMLRCAELTIQNGFKYFAVMDSSADSTTMYYNSGSSYRTTGTVNTFGNTSYGNFNTYSSGGAVIPIVKPSSAYTIACFKEKPESQMVFDADYLATSIAAKYNMRLVDGRVVKADANAKKKPKVHLPQ